VFFGSGKAVFFAMPRKTKQSAHLKTKARPAQDEKRKATTKWESYVEGSSVLKDRANPSRNKRTEDQKLGILCATRTVIGALLEYGVDPREITPISTDASLKAFSYRKSRSLIYEKRLRMNQQVKLWPNAKTGKLPTRLMVWLIGTHFCQKSCMKAISTSHLVS
jgi:hypothetical protein